MFNRHFIESIIILILSLGMAHSAMAKCTVLTSKGTTAPDKEDAISLLLQSDNACPKDVFAFRKWIKSSGLKLDTTMVANEGFHNPSNGSFSLFEMAYGQLTIAHRVEIQSGDFFFGHFTGVDADNHLIADQNPKKDSLMIEAFAWDAQNEVFNFYELRGDGKSGQWFYRGDSIDILADNKYLHRDPVPGQPKFGNRLRCAACHAAGGPIMKEISAPHNDWWEPVRKLDFGGRVPDAALNDMLLSLVPAEKLKNSVLQGIKKLDESGKFNQHKSTLSLQEKLRPLFCPLELNLESDEKPNADNSPQIGIPVDFFVDPMLIRAANATPVMISRQLYNAALDATGSHFPGTNDKDADHAWLTPVKATSDHVAINRLLQDKIVDLKFVTGILSTDLMNPLFSGTRCQMLRFVPDKYTIDWQAVFIKNLAKSNNPAAQQLAKDLANPSLTPVYYAEQAEEFLQNCRARLRNGFNVIRMHELLMQRRAEVRASEISKNPNGQILEPGFRVIFPQTNLKPVPGKLWLTLDCEVRENTL